MANWPNRFHESAVRYLAYSEVGECLKNGQVLTACANFLGIKVGFIAY